MIDIFAKWKDGKLVCVPKKRRGMTKGEYLRALAACESLNVDESLICPQSLSSLAHKDLCQVPLSQLLPSEEKNIPEREPIALASPQDDAPQTKQLNLFYIPEK